MENASKALLMAAGILMAMIIIGLLLFMFNQLGTFQKSDDSNTKNSQVAKFNMQFEVYLDDKGIKGSDIISLINKILDYNQKGDESETLGDETKIKNSVDYSIKMSIRVNGLKSFNDKYAYSGSPSEMLFPTNSYIFGQGGVKNNTLKQFTDAEATVGNKDLLKQLSSIYNIKDKQNSINKIKEKLKEIDYNKYKDWNVNTTPTLDQIIKYRQYSEFASSTFVVDAPPEYNNGQIQKLYFKFDR